MTRNLLLDVLKLSLAFMVIGIHTNFLNDYSLLGEYLTVNGVFRIAVPIFLISNGYYFYSCVTNNRQIIWLKRISILYIIWMLFYSYFWLKIDSFTIENILNIIYTVVIGYHHLWYISGMIGAAIILLFLRKLSTNIILLTILVSYVIGVCIQYIGNYHLSNNTTIDVIFNYHWSHRNLILFSYPFFCIGYMINKHSFNKYLTNISTILLSIIGLFLLLTESYINFYQINRDGGFDNYISLIVICPAFFILVINTKKIIKIIISLYIRHRYILYIHFS